jgi:hypothetical protein
VLPDTLARSSTERSALEELWFVSDQVQWTFEPDNVFSEDTGVLGP